LVPSPGRRPQAAAHFLFHRLEIFGAFSEYPVRRDFGPASSIKLKRAAGRPKDLESIAELQTLLEEGKR